MIGYSTNCLKPTIAATDAEMTAREVVYIPQNPDVQDEVRQMLGGARRAGFHLRVVSTYRSPQQEAILMTERGGRTHTLTSLHSYDGLST